MLMRVQGDTLEEQRSAEPTPEPLTANRDSPLSASSKGSSAGSLQRETPSPYKSDQSLLQRPGSRTKRRIFGHDEVDRNTVNSPLQFQQSQSDSAPSLNLSSNSPVPSSPPAILSQESDSKQQEGRPGSRNSVSPVPQSDTGQYPPNSRNRSVSPLDKARVRQELAQWAVKENAMHHPQINGKVSLPPRANSVSVMNRYQQPCSHSPPPALMRMDHCRQVEGGRRNSHSPTPPPSSPQANSMISYQSHLDSWVMHADGKGIPELPHSPPVRYQPEPVLSPSLVDRQNSRTRQTAYQSTQPVMYQTVQGWKTQSQNIPVQPAGAIPARRYSQGRPPLVADDRRLLMEGDRLLRKELEEMRAGQHYHRPGVTTNQMLPQHRQLPLSPPNSTSSIISGSSIPTTIGQSRQQKQYIAIAGANVNETRV